MFLQEKYSELKCMAAQDISEGGIALTGGAADGEQQQGESPPDVLRPPLRRGDTRDQSNSLRSAFSSSSSNLHRHEPGAFLFHSSTQVNLADLEEEESVLK